MALSKHLVQLSEAVCEDDLLDFLDFYVTRDNGTRAPRLELGEMLADLALTSRYAALMYIDDVIRHAPETPFLMRERSDGGKWLVFWSRSHPKLSYRYALLEDGEFGEVRLPAYSDTVPERKEEDKPKKEVRTWDECKDVTFKDDLRSYNAQRDEYILYLSKLGHTTVPGQVVREMYSLYSKFGLNLTRQEVAIQLNIDRILLVKMMEALGLQKGSLHITPEVLARTSVDSAVEHLEKNRSLQVLKRSEAKKLATIEKELTELKDHQQWVKGIFNRVVANEDALKRPAVKHKPEGTTAFWSMHDEHWGKKPHNDDNYTIEDQLEEMSAAADKVVSRLKDHENLEEIVTVFGSDMFHVDTVKKATTRGTPQDMMTSVQGMTTAVVNYFTMCVHKAKEVAPVTIYVVAGNHDSTLVEATGQFLAYIFRNDERVRVVSDNSIRKYHSVGDTLVMIHHSDVKPSNLSSIIDTEARRLFPGQVFRRKVIMGGHLHSFKLKIDSTSNEVHTTATSPSKTDRWTYENYGEGVDRLITLYFVETSGPLSKIEFVKV